ISISIASAGRTRLRGEPRETYRRERLLLSCAPHRRAHRREGPWPLREEATMGNGDQSRRAAQLRSPDCGPRAHCERRSGRRVAQPGDAKTRRAEVLGLFRFARFVLFAACSTRFANRRATVAKERSRSADSKREADRSHAFASRKTPQQQAHRSL